MTLAQLLPLAITVSIFLTVFVLGLDTTLREATYLFRNPSLLFRSILSMNVLMVIFAFAVALLFDLHPAVQIALIALAVSPVPPLLPAKQTKDGGTESYAVGLLVAAVLLAIVLAPASIELIGPFFSGDAHVSPGKIVPVVLVSAIIPLALGMLVHRFVPGLGDLLRRPVHVAATILLVAAALPVLVSMSGAIWNLIGDGALIVLALFTLVGLAIGHMLGGPNPDDRTVLALATCARHPGIALTIATLNFPERKVEVMAVVIMHLVVGAAVALPYHLWRRRSHAASAA